MKTLALLLKQLGPVVLGALGVYLATAYPAVYSAVCAVP